MGCDKQNRTLIFYTFSHFFNFNKNWQQGDSMIFGFNTWLNRLLKLGRTWSITENSTGGGKRPRRRAVRRGIWLAILIAAIPAIFAAVSIGVAFGLSRSVTAIGDVCAQNNSTASTAVTPSSSTAQTGAQCALVFNGFGSLWHYDGGKYPIGLQIDSQAKALVANGRPDANNGVVSGTSFGVGPVISVTNQIGGPALYANGGGSIIAARSNGPALLVSNAGDSSGLVVQGGGNYKSPALFVQGQAAATVSQTTYAAVQGSNTAAGTSAVGVHGTTQNGVGLQGDSQTGIGVYAFTSNTDLPAAYISNFKAGGPAFEFDGGGKIKGNVAIQGNLEVSSLAVNDDSVPLTQGDLVVVTGIAGDNGGVPILKVRLSRNPADPAVIGVVDQPYSPPSAVPVPFNDPNQKNTIAPGGQLVVATLGAYQVLKVDSSNGPIVPGSLLVSSGANAGYAALAKPITVSGQQLPPMGVIGKALAPLSGDKGTIAVLLTQH